ncbi:ABC transporter ATP-binding protein [Kribbella sp. NPDC004536]|uniref:ABC transporter ATP-binding protein n=1 Tax=Kribbella sp. NPDC004536 TaxID=3364106 RepID=UPI0036B1D147
MSDPLFGAGIRIAGPWAEHFSAAARVGLWASVKRLPQLTRLAVGTAWSADRAGLVGAVLAQVVQAVLVAAGFLAVNQALIGLLTSGPTVQRVRAAAPALIVAAVMAGCGSLAKALASASSGRLAPRVQRRAEQLLLEKAVNVEIATLDDGQFNRSLASAQLGVKAIESLTTTLLTVAGSSVGVVAIAGAVGTLHPLLVPLMLLGVVPQGWKALKTARWEHASSLKMLNSARQKDVLVGVVTGQGAPAEEIRVHQLGDFLLGHYQRIAEQLEVERGRLAQAQAVFGVVTDAAGGLARIVAYLVLGWLLTSGVIPPAAAGTAVIAMAKVAGQLSSLLTQFNGMYRHGLFVSDYTSALRLASARAIPLGGEPVPESWGVISVCDVQYRYEGTTSPALRGVSLEIRRGQVIALVGKNGSGKSTLARVIAGLHEPDHGSISWDGIDSRKLDRADVFSRVGWIAQDFQRWPFTARANVAIGRIREGESHRSLEMAATFADAASVIAGLPEQWDTLLAREFLGGVNLSGGQWQRLAIARAHYRDAEVLICDEPTAALDPVSEVEALKRILALADEQRVVLMITHRLGSVRHADRIYVLDDGQIVESGSHDDLMRMDGLFARMYRAQRRQYGLSGDEDSSRRSARRE